MQLEVEPMDARSGRHVAIRANEECHNKDEQFIWIKYDIHD